MFFKKNFLLKIIYIIFLFKNFLYCALIENFLDKTKQIKIKLDKLDKKNTAKTLSALLSSYIFRNASYPFNFIEENKIIRNSFKSLPGFFLPDLMLKFYKSEYLNNNNNNNKIKLFLTTPITLFLLHKFLNSTFGLNDSAEIFFMRFNSSYWKDENLTDIFYKDIINNLKNNDHINSYALDILFLFAKTLDLTIRKEKIENNFIKNLTNKIQKTFEYSIIIDNKNQYLIFIDDTFYKSSINDYIKNKKFINLNNLKININDKLTDIVLKIDNNILYFSLSKNKLDFYSGNFIKLSLKNKKFNDYKSLIIEKNTLSLHENAKNYSIEKGLNFNKKNIIIKTLLKDIFDISFLKENENYKDIDLFIKITENLIKEIKLTFNSNNNNNDLIKLLETQKGKLENLNSNLKNYKTEAEKVNFINKISETKNFINKHFFKYLGLTAGSLFLNELGEYFLLKENKKKEILNNTWGNSYLLNELKK